MVGGCSKLFLFYYESKFKIWGGGGEWRRGARVREFFHKESKSIFFFFFFFFGGGGGGGVVDGWTAEQAQTNLALQLLRSWGHNNALIY